MYADRLHERSMQTTIHMLTRVYNTNHVFTHVFPTIADRSRTAAGKEAREPFLSLDTWLTSTGGLHAASVQPVCI